jgi:hypothetical protein
VQSLLPVLGDFEHFKLCHRFLNLMLTVKAAAADLVAAEKFLVLVQTVIERQGYFPQQVLSLVVLEVGTKYNVCLSAREG